MPRNSIYLNFFYNKTYNFWCPLKHDGICFFSVQSFIILSIVTFMTSHGEKYLGEKEIGSSSAMHQSSTFTNIIQDGLQICGFTMK